MSTKYTSKPSNGAICAAVTANINTQPDAFIGIDYHKRYSVYHVVDAEGKDLAKFDPGDGSDMKHVKLQP